MDNQLEKKIEEIQDRIADLPRGTLTYKTIKGKKQPYLQWTENGRSYCDYIKVGEREKILIEVEERSNLQRRLARLKGYRKMIPKLLGESPMLGNRLVIGGQDFKSLYEDEGFYVDKSRFLVEWWTSGQEVTVITRPRRFGKTLMLSLVENFFSIENAGNAEMFERLDVWKWEKLRKVQGTYPVISITFAEARAITYEACIGRICDILRTTLKNYSFLMETAVFSEYDKRDYDDLLDHLKEHKESSCEEAIAELSSLLYKYYNKRVILLLDEYDTPMIAAYNHGYWEELSCFMRNLFSRSFKTNRYLKRGLITGITRIAKESIYSGMNNAFVYTMTSDKYADCFGFTEPEVFESMVCHTLTEQEEVKRWYDGFTIGNVPNIYNPWSIVQYMNSGVFAPYWINSASTELIDHLILRGHNSLKEDLLALLQGESIRKRFDENINFRDLEWNADSVWSLLFATGYLKADHVMCGVLTECDLSITNEETMRMFELLVQEWFHTHNQSCSPFCTALFADDLPEMNRCINELAMEMISVFDAGTHPSEKAPERFYHGFVLGLLTDLKGRYRIRSNRESGRGRCDVIMEPEDKEKAAFLIEFKVRDETAEKDLKETAQRALDQIEEKGYERELIDAGISREQIRSYGFAFEGKAVLIMKG